jgi:nucleotide-binding universal stress UspA family protein
VIRRDSEVSLVAGADHAQMAAQAKRIVVGFDGTEGARRALDAATQLMGYGSTLTVVRVRDEGPSDDERDPLDAARDLLIERLITARYEQRVGDPADEIVGVARDLDADVIVVGRRGPKERNGAGPGSVSADVVRRAGCDVLVVGG